MNFHHFQNGIFNIYPIESNDNRASISVDIETYGKENDMEFSQFQLFLKCYVSYMNFTIPKEHITKRYQIIKMVES